MAAHPHPHPHPPCTRRHPRRLLRHRQRRQRRASAAAAFRVRVRRLHISTSCCAFDPGLAHMSSTVWCRRTSRRRGGTIETASCRWRLPRSCSRMSHAWKALTPSFRPGPPGASVPSQSRPRSCARLTSNCHASRSGYHGSEVGGDVDDDDGAPAAAADDDDEAAATASASGGRTDASMDAERRRRRAEAGKRHVTGSGVRRMASKSFHRSLSP